VGQRGDIELPNDGPRDPRLPSPARVAELRMQREFSSAERRKAPVTRTPEKLSLNPLKRLSQQVETARGRAITGKR
jgi:hypothetical protein